MAETITQVREAKPRYGNVWVFPGKVWNFLTRPPAAFQEAGRRHQAQLIAGLSFLLALASLAGVVMGRAMNGSKASVSSQYTLLVLFVFMLFSYVFSRTRFYAVSSAIVLAAFSILSSIGVLTGDPDPVGFALTFLPLAFMIGSVLLSMRGILIFTVVNLLILVLLKTFPGVAWVYVGTVSGQVITYGILLAINNAIRNAIERDRLAETTNANKELEALSTSMEQRVAERTREILVAVEIGQYISRVQNLGELLPEAVELIRERFNLYYAQIYLANQSGNRLVLRAGTGMAGAELFRGGHRLPVDLTSINGTAAVKRQAVVVPDTTRSLIHRSNPLLPQTRSEMAIPLIAGNRLLGVLDLQSSEAGALTEESLPAFQIMGGQLATALTNSELFERIERSLVEVETRSRQTVRKGWNDYQDGIHKEGRVGFVYEQQAIKPLLAPLDAVQDAELRSEALQAETPRARVLPAGALQVPIQVAGEQVGEFQLIMDHAWSPEEKAIVNTIAQQVAQQVENIRLLDQAERYRRDAEEAVRHMTHQEWDEYMHSAGGSATGFVYTQDLVQPLQNEPDSAVRFGIKIREEQVGQFCFPGIGNIAAEEKELVSAVSEQLGAHLENIRLYTTAQQELKERRKAEAQLQTVVEHMPVSVVAKDNSGKFVMWNRTAEQLFGFPAEMVLGKTDYDFYPKEQADFFHAKDIEALNARQIVDIPEEPIDTRDRGTRLLHTMKVPVFDEKDQPQYLLVVSEDITERKEAQETIAKRAVELATVAEVTTRVSTIQDPEAMLQMVVDLTRQAFGLYHVHIYLLNDAGDMLTLSKGSGEIGRKMMVEGRQIACNAERSLVARAAHSHQGVIVNDVHQEPGFLPNPLLPDTCSEMAVPMIAGDRLLGVVDVQDSRVGRFTPEDVNIMTTLAAQIAVSLQNARSYARAHRQAEREALINAISERIQATNSVESALQVAVREIGRALGAQHAAVRLGLERSTDGA